MDDLDLIPEENILSNDLIYKEINKKDKMSNPILTKYEKTKIIGISAQQIQAGRKPYIEIPNTLVNPLDIAEYELKHKKTPFIVKRKLPHNSFEYFTIEQLIII